MITYRSNPSYPSGSFAWPKDWSSRHAYRQMYWTLHQTSPERLSAIINGTDQATNTDLAKWRGIDRKKSPRPLGTP